MKIAVGPLPDDVNQLKELLLLERQLSADQHHEIKRLKQSYQQLLEQFRLAQQRQFGKSSEVSGDQLGLFNETETIIAEQAEAPQQEIPAYTRHKPKRKPPPKDLPREQVIHDLDDADKICDCCGHELHRMGEQSSEQLAFIPAQVKVIEHIRPKYSCRHCEQHGTKVKIKIAPVPPSPIPKSIATPSLLSQIITSKYQYALPLYRQEQMFQQYGIDLNRKTMADWMIRCNELLEPMIYQRLKAMLLQQAVIYADETPLNVIQEERGKCYMWVYCSGTDSPKPDKADWHPPDLVLYEYQNSRGQCPKDFLDGFSGYTSRWMAIKAMSKPTLPW